MKITGDSIILQDACCRCVYDEVTFLPAWSYDVTILVNGSKISIHIVKHEPAKFHASGDMKRALETGEVLTEIEF